MIQPTIQSSLDGVQSTAFTIEANESMFALLTSRVYNDVILAPIREWSTNAIDACIAAGTEPRFDVHLPTFEEPYLSVRDYGTGLPPEDMLTLFCTFGASTKRTSNDFNGTFGIGRISALAYTSSFTVESFYDGMHHSYLITVSNGLPSAVELGSSPSAEPAGLRLSLTVNTKDISAFRSRAERLYRYFSVKPTLNIELDIATPKYSVVGSNWAIDTSLNGNYVRMSNILYKIPDNDQLETHKLSGFLIDMPNGSINYNPGRESLSLDRHTIDILNKTFTAIKEELLNSIAKSIDDAPTPREKLVAYNLAFNTLTNSVSKDIPIPSLKYINILLVQAGHRSSIQLAPAFSHALFRTVLPDRKSVSNDLPNVKELLTRPVIVADQKTSFTATARYISKTLNATCTLLSPAPQASIKDFLAEVKDFLSCFGLTSVHYTSTYTVSTPSSNAARKSSGVYVAYLSGGTAGKAELASPSTTYYYVPLKGTVPLMGIEKAQSLSHLLCLFNLELCGVPKKYLAAAEKAPNLIDAEKYIESLLPTTTFHTYEGFYGLSSLRPLKQLKVPPMIQTAIDEYEKSRTGSSTFFLESAKKFYQIQHEQHRPTYAIHEIYSKYPLLEALLKHSISTYTNVIYYLDLEEAKNGKVNSTP